LRAKLAQYEAGTSDKASSSTATPSAEDPPDAKPGTHADRMAMLKEMVLKSDQQAARARANVDMISTRWKSGNAKNAALKAKDSARKATTPEERQDALNKMEQCLRDAAHFKKEYKKLERKFRELPKDPFDPYTL
jgi:hypothetical protein